MTTTDNNTLEFKADDKALNKSEAYHIARLLLTDPLQVTQRELRGLLLHFAPTAGRVPKSAQDYVGQFVAKPSEVRYWLQHLYSDGGHLYACDGHCAAWCATDLEPGYYHPRTGDPVELDVNFPDMARVIPKRREQKPLGLDDWPCKESLGIKAPELRLMSPGGRMFHRDYILRAIKGADSVIYQEPAEEFAAMRGSVILKGKPGGAAQFVVMPIRT